MLRFIRKTALQNTSRHVRNEVYETARFLLEEDGLGLTVTDITIQPNVEETYGYDRHIEIAYCISGRATIFDLSTNSESLVEPGTMWIAEMGSTFRFRAEVETRLICVFTPPFRGHETGFAGDQ